MMTLDVPPTHRFALCLFLPDPARGPVPACRLLATAKTARGLEDRLIAVRNLAQLGALAWAISGIDYSTQHPVAAGDVVFAILPIAEARDRDTAHRCAGWLEYQDWMQRHSPAGSAA